MNPVPLLYRFSDMKKGNKEMHGKVRRDKARQRIKKSFFSNIIRT